MKYTEEQCWEMSREHRMDLRTMPGMQVIFVTFIAGYEAESNAMHKDGFAIGECYTVTAIRVGRSSSRVYLKGMPSRGFNTVFFCNIPGQKLPEAIAPEHLDYCMGVPLK